VNAYLLSPSFQEETTLFSSSSEISPTIVRVPSCTRISIPDGLGIEVDSHSSFISLFSPEHSQPPTHAHQPTNTQIETHHPSSNSHLNRMQQTTLSTRPLLISVNPIKGVVYKATQLNRPHPKISVMSIHEAQKHEKRESADMTSALRRKRDRHSSAHDPRYPVGAPSTAVPAVVRTYADHDVLAQLSNKDPRVTIEKKKPSSIHRLKDVLKKVFRSKDSTKPTIVCRKDTSVPISNKLLQSGFYCNMDGCNSCSPPVPSTPLNRDPIGRSLMAARQIGVSQIRLRFTTKSNISQPILEDASSFGSGFTISLSASSRAPSILSPASIDLDVFPDFDGVYIEPTPPQLAVSPLPL
jgi:hypothetical protein